MIKIRVAGVESVLQVVSKVGDSPRKTILGLSQATYDGGQEGAGRHNKTGALLQSLYNRPTATGRAVGHDPRRAPHAAFVNLGTRPHEIRPKEKKALRWASGGRFIFAKFVKHPGYIGDPYLFKAADEAIRRMAVIVDSSLR